MYHYPRHYARHLRQLHYLRKLCSQYQERGSLSQRLLLWVRKKLRFLVNRLFRRVTPQRWIGAASCIIAFLQTESVGIQAQHFLPQVINPFGISGLSDFQHAVLDLDDDGDVDFLSVGYGAGDEYELIFRENTSTLPTPAFAAPSMLPLNIGPGEHVTFLYSMGDLDNDGDIDILAVMDYAEIPIGYSYRYEPIISFIENIGTPESANFQLSSIDTLTTSVFNQGLGIPNLVDIDDDGDLDLFMDLLIYNFGFEIYEIHPVYYKNVGTPTDWNFIGGTQEPFNYQFPQDIQYMLHEFADIDNDGDQDLLAQSAFYDETLDEYITRFVYYENAGDPANPFFAPPMEDPFNLPGEMISQPCVPVLADWDKDGDLDLSCSQPNDYGADLVFFENIGSSAVNDGGSRNADLFDVKPNPAYSHLDLQFETAGGSGADILITDIHGRQVYIGKTSGTDQRIACDDWMPGHYIVRVVNEKISASKVVQVLR